MAKTTYKKYSKEDQRTLATWAAQCAERVLPLFEEPFPQDDRPRQAIEACHKWVSSGAFQMAAIRGASLAAHAAARDVAQNANGNEAASLAARAAGQAVATAHVTQHAYGGAYYALKAIAAAHPENALLNATQEHEWQAEQLPEHLRQAIMERITIMPKGKRGITVKIDKGDGY